MIHSKYLRVVLALKKKWTLTQRLSLYFTKGIFSLGLFLISIMPGFSQRGEYYQASAIQNKHGNFEDSVRKSEKILAQDSENLEALILASWAYLNIGNNCSGSQKKMYYQKAKAYCLEAIRVDNSNIAAHINYAMALGLLTEVEKNPGEKISNINVIKQEAEFVLALNPSNAEAHYILGRWHYEIASITWIEKLAADLLFGGTPEASLENSVYHYKKAISINPDFVLFYYDLARTYVKMGEQMEAIKILANALKLPPRYSRDDIRLSRCRKLLEEIT